MKTPKEYAATGGKGCPVCGSKWVCGLDNAFHKGEDFRQRIACDGCQSEWTDTYQLTGYIDLEPGPKVVAVDNSMEDET